MIIVQFFHPLCQGKMEIEQINLAGWKSSPHKHQRSDVINYNCPNLQNPTEKNRQAKLVLAFRSAFENQKKPVSTLPL